MPFFLVSRQIQGSLWPSHLGGFRRENNLVHSTLVAKSLSTDPRGDGNSKFDGWPMGVVFGTSMLLRSRDTSLWGSSVSSWLGCIVKDIILAIGASEGADLPLQKQGSVEGNW
jgi:hypothetical protein